MEALFIPRVLKINLRFSLSKYTHINLEAGEEVDVHSEFGKPITHPSGYLIDTEVVCILYQNHFFNIPLYYLEDEEVKIKTS